MSGHDITRRDVLHSGTVIGAGTAIALKTGISAALADAAAIPTPTDQSPPSVVTVTLTINNSLRRLELDPRVTLLDALREHLDLTGSKKGCDMGACGACTVLVDGRRMNACLLMAARLEGRKITTIEGLAQGATLHPLQAAFIDHDGFQCGYCTPGQIMSAVGMANENRPADPQSIRVWMSGNLCRCGAYPNIVAAIQAAGDAPQRKA